MSNDLPEMIPMSGEQQAQVPSQEDLTRQLSPQEEQNLLVNFMGNMYGEVQKMDNNIVNPSNTLQRGKSEEIKRNIEQVLAQPQQPAQQVQAAVTPPPVEQPQVLQPEVQKDDNLLSLNFDTNEKDEIFDIMNRVLTRLDNLNKKIDNLSEDIKNTKVTSLPIKKQTKKKSINKKEEN